MGTTITVRVASKSHARRTRRRMQETGKGKRRPLLGLGSGLFQRAIVLCGMRGLEWHIWSHPVQGNSLNPIVSAFGG